MSLLAVPIIAVIALALVIITSTLLFIFIRKNNEKLALLDVQVQSDSFLISELQANNINIQQQLTLLQDESAKVNIENNQVSKHLELRIKTLQTQIVDLEQQCKQWQESQSQDKFYTRAFKLAEKGADIEEIMHECELPRAEVEMLLSVYQQRNQLP